MFFIDAKLCLHYRHYIYTLMGMV